LDESLRNYRKKAQKISHQLSASDQRILVKSFVKGLRDGHLRCSLLSSPEGMASMMKVHECIQNIADAEESSDNESEESAVEDTDEDSDDEKSKKQKKEG
jgi:hypothetical protein